MHEIVQHLSLVIGVIGLTVILWGVLLGVLRLLRLEWANSADEIFSSNVKTCGITSAIISCSASSS